MLGFLPIFPLSAGPSLLGLTLLLLAIVINCHLASVFLFMGLGKIIGLALTNPAVAIGEQLSTVAAASSEIPFLYYSHWSHTGYLGMTILGLLAAPLIAIAMALFTVWFRNHLQPKLVARRKLVLAGKIGTNPLGLRFACWFMGI
jgi:hypothetical protein